MKIEIRDPDRDGMLLFRGEVPYPSQLIQIVNVGNTTIRLTWNTDIKDERLLTLYAKVKVGNSFRGVITERYTRSAL